MEESSNGENKWNCWSCGTKGKTAFQLFRKLKVSNEKLEELKTIVKETKTYQGKDNYYDKEKIELPKEFISLKNPNLKDIETKHVLSYLKKRGIEHSDIVKYNIGFCEEGKYEGRIIFPIYDEFNNLVFFDSRTYKDHSLRYLKPSYPKDFIVNDHFINWDLPIIICEGIFDAIAIKRNVIPLLGKIIQPNLMKKILKTEASKIYIVLDNDAIKKALQFCEELMNEGKEVYLVEMGEDDASKMGFERFTKLIKQTEKLTYSKFIEKKLNL